MKNLVESLGQMKSLSASINPILERYNSTDERVFWQWIEDLGGEDAINVIVKSAKKDYKDFYKLVADLGTTEGEYSKFTEIFFDKTNKILELIEDDEDAGMSDDSCEYASWSSPFFGKAKYEKALKSGDWKSVCNEYDGEQCGYALEMEEDYGDWLEENGIEPKGYAK